MSPPLLRMLLVLLLATHVVRGAAPDDGIAFFETRIRPVLVEQCYGCHSAEAETLEGELALDNRAAVRRGGRSGPIVVPGDPVASRLLVALEYNDPTLQMPPEGKMPQAVIDDFRHWIALKAPDPRDGESVPTNTIAARAATHWAFSPPRRSPMQLDQLISTKLATAGLPSSGPATRGELIRRLYFDLIGLPPTWEQVRAFSADEAPEAYDALVESLLASPQFGERWARHWLDVSRFADTKGYVFQEDREFPHAYKYRDWVISAFNDDLPIDQFLRYQIAADQLVTGDEQRHHLAAQGFVTLGRRFINHKPDIFADRIDVVFRGMMGLTVACARCHDHKFDPITDEDYYALYGILESSRETQDDDLPLRLTDSDSPHDVGVFARGNAHNRGPPVQRGFPRFFSHFAPTVETGSGRLQLAEAITHPDNPLTARVFVNRVWGHLFGEPLVTTPSDFGLRSDSPRQQDVLDLLAVEFVNHGWSLKWLVRELVTSTTYRQSSRTDAVSLESDPENQLWGRANRRRRDFEALRDALLAVSGQLDNRVGGPSEHIETAEGSRRRTLYAYIDRQNLPGLFRAFDFASPDTHSPERLHTVVPQQSLFLLNNPMVQRAARQVASTLVEPEPNARVSELYRRVLARDPQAREMELALQFLDQPSPPEFGPWPQLAQVLMVCNEFLFVD